MTRYKFCAALLAAVIAGTSLCSCGKTIKETQSSTLNTPESTSSPAIVSSEPSSAPQETTSETTQTTEAEQTEQTTTTEQTTATEQTSQTEAQPEPEFSFPAEFYEQLNAIFDKYSINQNCDPSSDPCGCVPEYEQVDEDGNVAVARDRVMSIYVYDATSGFELEINGGVHYPVASTVKIPFCVYVYDKITDGEIDPNTVLTYEKRHYFGGTGVIVKGDFGQQYTVLELLELAITESDNVAYEMLKDLVPWDEFEAYLVEIGCSHPEDTRKTQQKICTESAGAYGKELMRFLTSDSPYVDDFKGDLEITKNKMIKSHYPFYRKYGWTQFAFHDIAFVDAPHRYVLAILSNLEGEENEDYALFKEISYLVEDYIENNRTDSVTSPASDE